MTMETKYLAGRWIYFLDFKFNHDLRVLTINDKEINLIKKEADVLALLCNKAPNPVTPADFNHAVWRGRYVTSQSIAQVIRSLRLKLGDESKDIIVTLPKLGYKLLPKVTIIETELPDSDSRQSNFCQGCSFMKNGVAEEASKKSGVDFEATLKYIKKLQDTILHQLLELEKNSKLSDNFHLLESDELKN